jgi:ABC-type spermidine/putrescine transport system permease subunit II
MENLNRYYDHLVYFTAIGNTLGQFGIFFGHLVYFSPFWYFVPRKIWQPLSALQ